MKTRIVQLLTLFVFAAGAAACDSDSPTAPPVFVGPAEMQVTDLTVGTGATLAAGQTITANYALWLYNPSGTDLKGVSIGSGGLPATPLTTANLIAGWVQGLPGMKVGGVRRLLIPPSLAYGSAGSNDGRIPPNAWLVFDVQLLSAS
ncbi:MAG: FKBP-type peptidyl-prolyl cis-trans isomerase [Acidobacteriota bacterium]|nr:FKBP-type peptidyl-prolyl cis-trans isomerase [Acidobacteriota bacterium]